MSALPRQSDPSEFGYLGLRMSADEFIGLDVTRERYELIQGVVCMSPRPTTLHQRLLSLLQYQLELYVGRNPGCVYFPDVDLQVGPTTVYAPDIVAYRPGRVVGFPAKLETPPDLLVEILSHGTKAFDLTTKRDDYEKFGVGEYWTYDPTDGDPAMSGRGRLRCYRLQRNEVAGGGQSVFVEVPVAGDTFESVSLLGFVLDLKPLRATVRT